MHGHDFDRRSDRIALAALPPNAMSSRAKTSSLRALRAAGGAHTKTTHRTATLTAGKLSPSPPTSSVAGAPTTYAPFKTPPPAGSRPPSRTPLSARGHDTRGYYGTTTPPPGSAASSKSTATTLLAASAAKAARNHDATYFRPSGGRTPNTLKAHYESPASDMEVTPAPASPDVQGEMRRPEPCTVPRLTPEKSLPSHNPYLLPPRCPSKRDMLTVVFDLDETLVSNRNPGVAPATQRHYLTHMLRQIQGVAEIVLWTASTENTGSPVMQQIDPTGQYFEHVIYRNPKWFTDGSHTKDLKLLGREMDKVVIVENTPNCCKYNPENALMVEDFTGDLGQHDRTLLNVAQVIRDAAASVKKNVSISKFLNYYTRSLGSTIDIYELTLPASYLKMGKEAAMERINTLDPLFRPPLGLYYYIRKN